MSRPVGGGELDGNVLRAGKGKHDAEIGEHQAGVSFRDLDVTDADRRAVVVVDRADRGAVKNGRPDRVGKHDVERLIDLVDRVARDRNGDELLGGACGKREHPAGGSVVRTGGGRGIARGELHGDVGRFRSAHRHAEDHVLRAAVPLDDGLVEDPQEGTVVVDDRPYALAVGDGGLRGVGEIDEEGLARFDGRVIDDRDRHLLCRFARG